MKNLIFTLILCFLVFGYSACATCQSTADDMSKLYKTKSGKTVCITETHPMGQSLSTIKVHTEDFEHNYSEEFKNMDPISDIMIADLDENGFDEIYIVTTSAGSGSYGTILGFASNRDKSLSIINFPGFERDGPLFKGYLGNDTFSIEEQKLVRIFPVYDIKDFLPEKIFGKRKLIYGLYPGEAMWQLKVEQSETIILSDQSN